MFSGLDKNTLSVLLISKYHGQSKSNSVDFLNHNISTKLNRWMANERDQLFSNIQFNWSQPATLKGCLPKIGSKIESGIWKKIHASDQPLAFSYSKQAEYSIYYSRKVNSFIQVLDFIPEVYNGKGELRPPSEFKTLFFVDESHAKAVFCCLNSTLFRWFLDVVSDGSHLNKREVNNFPFSPDKASIKNDFEMLSAALSKSLTVTSEKRVMKYKHDTLTVQCIFPKRSKHLIDEIDHVLANYYGFTDEELDFIINYDIKYRMGLDALEEDS